MIRSAYSFRNSVGSIEEIASRLKEIGWRHLPIADFGSTFAHGHLKGHDLLPVYGVSIAVSPATKAKKPVTDDFVFLAKREVASVNKLLTAAFEQFRYVPMLKYEQMREADGVFKIAGHRARLDLLNPKDTFIGLSAACSKGYVERAMALGFRFVAMQNNRYPRPEDRDFWEVLCGRGASGQTYPQHIMSDDEWIASLNGRFDASLLEEAIRNRQMILAACEGVTIPRAKLLHPETDKTLRQLCEEGALTLGVDLSDPVYAERLETELKVIEGKEFTDYFLIFSDFMQHARRETLCGPARGSSAGSLVCFLTGITSVDPIKHSLLFFRFLDPGRSDYPDIDCDISATDREKVINYLVQKYGRDRVAKLGTIANFQAKNAIDEVTKALQVPKFHANDVVANVPKYAAGDDRSDGALSEAMDTVAGKRFLAKYPEMDVVRRFGGHPRHAGTHAAGVLLTDRPVIDLFSVDARTNTAQTDLKVAERLGALKADLLGLINLSIFKEALDQIGLPHDHLETLDLADSRVFDVLNEGKFSGVFQLEGQAAQELSRRIEFTSLEDISSISAIARPGPLASGAAEQWVRRKTGREATSYVHPSLEPYLNETYGLLIYQEQVMLIAKELAGLDWMQVSALRKAIGKSMGDEAMSKFGEPFVDGLLSIGWPEDDARKFWKDIVGFGKYSFNRCLAGDTMVRMANPNRFLPKEVSIEKLYDMYVANPTKSVEAQGRKPTLVSLTDDGIGMPQKAVDIVYSGLKPCTKYTFDDGSTVTCTEEHKFIVNGEWLPIGNASIGDTVLSLSAEKFTGVGNGRGKGHAKGEKYREARRGFAHGEDNPAWVNGVTAEFVKFKDETKGRPCEDCGKVKNRMEVHHNDFCGGKERPGDLSLLCVSCHKKRHYAAGRTKRWEKGLRPTTKVLIKKEPAGMKKTYDISMPTHHNFMLANGIVTHNSHSLSYAIVTYWGLWLKAYYPLEFAAACLTHRDKVEAQISFLRELAKEGYTYTPIDPKLSTDKWRVVNGKLVGPLTLIKGLGPKKVAEILSSRARGEPLAEKTQKLLSDPKTDIDTLYPVQERIAQVDLQSLLAGRPLTGCGEVKADGSWRENVLCCGIAKVCQERDENEPQRQEDRVKRGQAGFMAGKTRFVEIRLEDETGTLYAKIGRNEFDQLAHVVRDVKPEDEKLLLVRGTVTPDIDGLLLVKNVRVVG